MNLVSPIFWMEWSYAARVTEGSLSASNGWKGGEFTGLNIAVMMLEGSSFVQCALQRRRCLFWCSQKGKVVQGVGAFWPGNFAAWE